jgi:hypothetical protein
MLVGDNIIDQVLFKSTYSSSSTNSSSSNNNNSDNLLFNIIFIENWVSLFFMDGLFYLKYWITGSKSLHDLMFFFIFHFIFF